MAKQEGTREQTVGVIRISIWFQNNFLQTNMTFSLFKICYFESVSSSFLLSTHRFVFRPISSVRRMQQTHENVKRYHLIIPG